MWDLALIGNRSVAPDRIFDILTSFFHDDNHNIRYWAVEGLADLAHDAAIDRCWTCFTNDPSPPIRERAACSLAQSGMLCGTASLRGAAPARLRNDTTLDDHTGAWVFQALRDITGQTLPRPHRVAKVVRCAAEPIVWTADQIAMTAEGGQRKEYARAKARNVCGASAASGELTLVVG